MQGHRSGENDEVHDEVRKEGAGADIQLAIDDFARAGSFPLHKHLTAHRLLMFYFLRRLPEEQIRADGGAENGDKICQVS